MLYRRQARYFVTGKRPAILPPYALDFTGDVDNLESGRYRKKALEKWGYTDVAIWERPAPVKVG